MDIGLFGDLEFEMLSGFELFQQPSDDPGESTREMCLEEIVQMLCQGRRPAWVRARVDAEPIIACGFESDFEGDPSGRSGPKRVS